MMKKNAVAAILAVAAMSVAFGVRAAEPAQAPVPDVPPITKGAEAPAPKVAMGDAIVSAEKAWQADGRSARLHMSPKYGQVWDVRMVRDDKTRVRTFVDAQTGKVLAAEVIGINEPAPRHHRMAWHGPKGHCVPAPMMHQARGPHHGPNMMPPAPVAP